MKKGFSLLELIFAIVIIGVIASFAVPKFLDTKDSAVVSTMKRDISSIVSAVQTYYLQKGEIAKISDAITLNKQNWSIVDSNENKITDSNACLTLEVTSDKVLSLTMLGKDSNVCNKLAAEGIESQEYQLL